MVNKYYVLAMKLPVAGYQSPRKGDPFHKPKVFEYIPKETWYLQASGTPNKDIDRALRFESDKKAYAYKKSGGIKLAGYKVKEITPDSELSEASEKLNL